MVTTALTSSITGAVAVWSGRLRDRGSVGLQPEPGGYISGLVFSSGSVDRQM